LVAPHSQVEVNWPRGKSLVRLDGSNRVKIRTLAILAIIAIDVIAFAQPVNAQVVSHRYETGASLLQQCESQMGRSTYRECFDYVMGVSDTLDALKPSGATPNMHYCQGIDVAATRVVQVAALHMTEHPETLGLPASYLVTFALNEAYSCPAK